MRGHCGALLLVFCGSVLGNRPGFVGHRKVNVMVLRSREADRRVCNAAAPLLPPYDHHDTLQ
jgi:hypothetical protein